MPSNFLYNSYIYYRNIQKNIIIVSEDINETFSIIGLYDTVNKIWINGWALYCDENFQNQLVKSKKLLNYALNLETDMNSIYNMNEKIIIRSILINSKFFINEIKTQLNIIIAIICYLLKVSICKTTFKDNIRIYYVK